VIERVPDVAMNSRCINFVLVNGATAEGLDEHRRINLSMLADKRAKF
jgi:hypothetical protein